MVVLCGVHSWRRHRCSHNSVVEVSRVISLHVMCGLVEGLMSAGWCVSGGCTLLSKFVFIYYLFSWCAAHDVGTSAFFYL